MRGGGQPAAVRPGACRRFAAGVLTGLVLAGTPAGPGSAHIHRTAADCAGRLDCRVSDLDALSMAERLDFLRALQAGPVSALVPGFDRWRAIEGVLEFFAAESVGRPGDWMSLVDASILEGVERGTAIALGVASDPFGNPGAPLWASYLHRLRAGELAGRAAHDAAWSRAEQAATNHGIALAAARGAEPTADERRFFLISEVYRGTLRHQETVRAALAAPGPPPAFLTWFTNVRDGVPTRKGAALAYRIARFDPVGTAVRAVDLVLLTYLPTVCHELIS